MFRREAMMDVMMWVWEKRHTLEIQGEFKSGFDGPAYSLRGTSQSENTVFYFADINGDGKADQVRWNFGENSGELRNYFAK